MQDNYENVDNKLEQFERRLEAFDRQSNRRFIMLLALVGIITFATTLKLMGMFGRTVQRYVKFHKDY